MLTVTGLIFSKGRARALISQVPPESIRQGADASTGLRSRIFFMDWNMNLSPECGSGVRYFVKKENRKPAKKIGG
jgi:hypothetical protein